MRMKKFKNPLLPFENKWVALTRDGKMVVASASSVKMLSKKLEKVKQEVVMTKVFPFEGSYSP